MEQALVFASIIVGVAVSDQVISLNRLLVERNRVRWDWAPLVLALFVLLTNLQLWWGLASQQASAITIGAFLPTLVILILLALLSAASLPGESEDGGYDLHAYYEGQASYLWTLFALALGWSMVMGLLEQAQRGGAFAVLYDRISDLIPLTLMVSLVFVRRRWWLACCFAVLSLGPINWLSRTLS